MESATIVEIEPEGSGTQNQNSKRFFLCKEFRKIKERLRKRKKSSCSGLEKDKRKGLFNQKKKNGILPVTVAVQLPALPCREGLDSHGEKWDWDYYGCEDFGVMRWGNEWGQFEEPCRGPYNRNVHTNDRAYLIKRQSQNAPYNLHVYSDGERYYGRPRCVPPLQYTKFPGMPTPHGFPDGCKERDTEKDSYNTLYMDGPQTKYSQGPHLQYINVGNGENFCAEDEKYCELPNRFQRYTKRYNPSGENKRPLTARMRTASLAKRKLKTFIPLNDSADNSKQGLRFRQCGKITNWSSIKLRHERVKANMDKIAEVKEEKRRKRKHIWELRLKVGLCKRNLQQQQKAEIPKVEDDLEKSYHLVYWIGHGQNAYNVVGRFYDMQKNRMVALKIFSHKAPLSTAERLENKLLALAEAKCLLELDHPNIISLFTYFEMEEKVHLVLEPCDHNLRAEISSAPSGIPESLSHNIIHQVLRGLTYCHSKKYLHRDLCPENILINTDGIVKIADFDKAIFLNEARGIFPPGTVTYGAPELLAREMNCCGPLEASDVWSIGVILCELLLGAPLWNCETEKKQLDAIQIDMGFYFTRYLSRAKCNKLNEIAYITKRFSGFSDETLSFLQNCLRMDPSKRSSCNALINNLLGKESQDQDEVNPNNSMPLVGAKPLPLSSDGKHGDNIRDPYPAAKYSPSFDNPSTSTEEENEEPGHEPTLLPSKISLPPQRQKRDSNKIMAKDMLRNKVAPQSGPNLPRKVTSEASHNRKGGNSLDNDPVKYSQSQMIVRESYENYNLRIGSAGDDVDAKDSQMLLRINEKPRRKCGLSPSMDELIDALPNANWNAVPLFKRQFDLVKKADPVAFKQKVNTFILALMKQISSTKTTVAGPAIKILSSLLKDNDEIFYPELEKLVHTLIQKIGGPYFIEHECCDALHSLVNMAPPVKICLAFTNKADSKYLWLKNANTRYVTSFYLYQAMINLNIESDIGESTPIQKKLTGAVFKTTLWLIQDQDPKTRKSAKDILGLLLQHPRFWEFYRNFVPENQLAIVHKVLREFRPSNNGPASPKK